jgi:glycine oxidase
VKLRHMLRLLHPRFPVYIVPRAEGRLVVGATSIESENRSAVSVRGALELLTSAYSVLPALAEARILEFNTQVRPALPDNLPALHFDRRQNVLRINGLYRHGFLLTPVVVEEALSLLPMARAFAEAVRAGRSAFLAGPMIVQELAVPSTPEFGRPFSSGSAVVADSQVGIHGL